MIASLFAASFGITVMIFASPLLVRVALNLGPAEMFAIMMLGLLAGSTMARGSVLKGVAMTILGLLIGLVGTDVNSGLFRFTFGLVAGSPQKSAAKASRDLIGRWDLTVKTAGGEHPAGGASYKPPGYGRAAAAAIRSAALSRGARDSRRDHGGPAEGLRAHRWPVFL